jgi:hypothetical protein
LAYPVITSDPSQDGAEGSPAHDRYRRYTFFLNADKAANEDDDGTDVLYDDSRVRDKGPEVIGSKARIAL